MRSYQPSCLMFYLMISDLAFFRVKLSSILLWPDFCYDDVLPSYSYLFLNKCFYQWNILSRHLKYNLIKRFSYIFFSFVEIRDAPILAAPSNFDLPQRWYSTCLSTFTSSFSDRYYTKYSPVHPLSESVAPWSLYGLCLWWHINT